MDGIHRAVTSVWAACTSPDEHPAASVEELGTLALTDPRIVGAVLGQHVGDAVRKRPNTAPGPAHAARVLWSDDRFVLVYDAYPKVGARARVQARARVMARVRVR